MPAVAGEETPEEVLESVLNAFCPGAGARDNSCSPSGGGLTRVGKAEHLHADSVEKLVAKALGGKQLDDNEPSDVSVLKADGSGNHAVEVKSMLKGSKKSISVHDDALLRKVEYAAANPSDTFHTVVVDERATYEGGEHSAQYSGHRMYYKRGSGRYSLSKMHPVENEAELKALLDTSDESLPEAARGSLPSNVDELREKAVRAHASRLAKDRARKARLKRGS